jgi:colanic acid/amylovoran biosynthesis protein
MTALLRLATFAVPLSGNKGSASMVLGLRDAFTAAGVPAHFRIFSYYFRRDARLAESLELENVSVHPGHPKEILFGLLPWLLLGKILPGAVPRRWREHLQALAECDAVLLIGGTTFADSMLYKVPWNVLAALPGYLLGKPTLFLSQTFGPLRHPLNRWLARWTLSRAAAVHGRGRTSGEWLERCGLGRGEHRPDLSFSLAIPPFEEIAQRVPAVRRLQDEVFARGIPAVGVAPNSIVEAKAQRAGLDYVEFLAGAIRTIRARGFQPVLIPHCYLDSASRRHNNDRGLCAAVLERLGADDACFYLDADLTAAELRSAISRLHLLVSSRFHSMISALATGVPPLTYGWGGHKYLEVLARFEVSELYADAGALDLADFALRLEQVHAEREELAARIRGHLARVQSECALVPAEIASTVADVRARRGVHPSGLPRLGAEVRR